MPFDQDPADEYEFYQCEVCGGNIKLNEDETKWECDTCDLQYQAKTVKSNKNEKLGKENP